MESMCNVNGAMKKLNFAQNPFKNYSIVKLKADHAFFSAVSEASL